MVNSVLATTTARKLHAARTGSGRLDQSETPHRVNVTRVRRSQRSSGLRSWAIRRAARSTSPPRLLRSCSLRRIRARSDSDVVRPWVNGATSRTALKNLHLPQAVVHLPCPPVVRWLVNFAEPQPLAAEIEEPGATKEPEGFRPFDVTSPERAERRLRTPFGAPSCDRSSFSKVWYWRSCPLAMTRA
jgi:hypothetical protein